MDIAFFFEAARYEFSRSNVIEVTARTQDLFQNVLPLGALNEKTISIAAHYIYI
jgi:hypothetical protein